MENLRKLQECSKRNITFKQAFHPLGMTEVEKPLKDLKEKEEFSALVNWALNRLPPFYSMDLRQKVDDKIYQTPLQYNGKQIRARKTILKTDHPRAITYDWPAEMTYESLTVDMITMSAKRADIINAAKMEGKSLTEQPVTELANPQLDWKCLSTVEQTPIELTQPEKNYCKVVLNEEERELLNEFLDV